MVCGAGASTEPVTLWDLVKRNLRRKTAAGAAARRSAGTGTATGVSCNPSRADYPFHRPWRTLAKHACRISLLFWVSRFVTSYDADSGVPG